MNMWLPETIRVLMPDGSVSQMPLEDYVRGVVAATCEALGVGNDAPLEALKAQAVAARTFAATTHRHSEQGADVCTQRHCQVWSARVNPRAARAVLETRGIVAVHNGQLIEAFYFEHCDGKTREGASVLVHAPAYLKSVVCPCGFATLKGHGIGMCQRGMLVMARFGETYDYILKHFYTGIILERGVFETTSPQPIAEGDASSREVTRRHTRAEPRQRGDVSGRPPQSESVAPPKVKPPHRTTAPRRPPHRKTAPESAGVSPPRVPVEPPPSPSQPVGTPVEPPPPLSQPVGTPEERIVPSSENPAAVDTPSRIGPIPDAPSHKMPIFGEVRRDDASMEAEDLLYYLAVEGVEEARPRPTPPIFYPASFDSTPPPTMPEELPRALELELIEPPSAAATSPETLVEFREAPLVERIFTPLDAPPSMPEPLPSFGPVPVADATPIVWTPPPPLDQAGWLAAPQVWVDYLPGPRIIAGNLSRPGIIVTIRDAQGNSVVTVSGAAKQYGAGGFEAPLTDEGIYTVHFGEMQIEVNLHNETAFLYCA